MAAFAQTADFPKGLVEHVTSAKSDIIHCLMTSSQGRQWCRAGWGPKFEKLNKLNIIAPQAYGSELLIPDSTPTPAGAITAATVLERLRGSLWTKWGVYPELAFMLDWSHSADCWPQQGVLATSIEVISAGQILGKVTPEQIDYTFPLVTPSVAIWRDVVPGSQVADRVQWRQRNAVAVYSEFDFHSPAESEYGFSAQLLPQVCTIQIYNVQTILNRQSTTRASADMQIQAANLVQLLTVNALLFAENLQGSDTIKCLLFGQLESLKASESLPQTATTSRLSSDSKKRLLENLQMTAEYTGANKVPDFLVFLDEHSREFAAACNGSSGLSAIESSSAIKNPTAAAAADRYRETKAQLREVIKDAWALAIVMQQVNTDSRNLQWIIDASIKYFQDGL